MQISKDLHLSRNLFKPSIDKLPTRSGYGEGVVEAGEHDKNVVVLSGDLTDSTKSRDFANKFPDRFYEVGVAEQNMAGLAAGLALSGKVPFMASYGVFSPGRNWDQIRISICMSGANVKIVSSHAGLITGDDGPTAQALEDIALTRVLPNMTVIAPADFEEAKKATIAAAKHDGPVYLRLTRPKMPVFTTDKTPFKIGKAYVLSEGTDLTIIATGDTVYEALTTAHKMHETKKISCEVINCPTIKPLDSKTILKSAAKTGKVITIEDHQINGGLGSAVAELLSQEHPTPMKILGVQDTFGESGHPEELKYKYKIDHAALQKAIKEMLG